MDAKLLNLAEQAGMRYREGIFYFTYDELEEFYRLVKNEKTSKNSEVL